MASTEHKILAEFIKEVHLTLRKSSSKNGAAKAWLDHCENKGVLATYAKCMQELATSHWERNCSEATSAATSRITWTADFCQDYFINKTYLQCIKKESVIANKIGVFLETEDCFCSPVKLIDVGSCYNPFRDYDFLDVFAIDLFPANDFVKECDFINVAIGPECIVENNKVQQLQEKSYDAVTFCFLLEYIPDPRLRITACENAYRILKPGGLLIINTPDSKHVGANSKIMKCWRYSLACMGFTRIKYEKFKHMHCMAFRKALHKDIAVRWAMLHKEPYMDYTINIPQDSNNETPDLTMMLDVSVDDFRELPFFEDCEDVMLYNK